MMNVLIKMITIEPSFVSKDNLSNLIALGFSTILLVRLDSKIVHNCHVDSSGSGSRDVNPTIS